MAYLTTPDSFSLPRETLKLIRSPQYVSQEARCPFIKNCQVLSATEVNSQTSGRRATLTFTLQKSDIQILRQSNSARHKQLHLRAFSNRKHEDWAKLLKGEEKKKDKSHGVKVTINSAFFPIPFKEQKSGTKKRGFIISKPLDISTRAADKMDIKIDIKTNFNGLFVVELATYYTIGQVNV